MSSLCHLPAKCAARRATPSASHSCRAFAGGHDVARLPQQRCSHEACSALMSPRVDRVSQASRQVRTSAYLAEPWGVAAALCCTAATALAMEQYTKIGKKLTSVVLAIAISAGLAAVGVIPTTCGTYDAILRIFLPLGAALYLLGNPLVTSTATKTLVSSSLAFAVATVGTIAGTATAWLAVGGSLASAASQGTASGVASALCASYVGGSVNFAAVVQALDVAKEPLTLAAIAVDNIAMTGYFIVLNFIRVSSRKKAKAISRTSRAPPKMVRPPAAIDPETPSADRPAPISDAVRFAVALAVASGAACLGSYTGIAIGWPSFGLAFMTLYCSIASTLAELVRRRVFEARRSYAELMGSTPGGPPDDARDVKPLFSGTAPLSTFLLTLFFATIGASTGSGVFAGGLPLAVFVVVLLSVHVAVVLAGVRLLRLPMDAALIASNAAVGGASTAAAMAAARGWPQLTQVGMLLGSAGYSIGTAVGMSMHTWMMALV